MIKKQIQSVGSGLKKKKATLVGVLDIYEMYLLVKEWQSKQKRDVQ